MRFGRILRLAAATAFLAGAPAWAEPAPSRIVSINLCADELLIALADPAQIAALSIYATNPTLSFFAEEARRFRHDAADAESVVGLSPDLVLAGRFTKRATRDMLKELGYRLVELDAARSVADSLAQIREVAGLLGHPQRGQALVDAIDSARARAASSRALKPTVAVYQRRGYVSGSDTLATELLDIVGLANAGGGLAGATGGFVPLERLVADPPDYLVVASLRPPAEDQGSALLAHPALAALFPETRRIALPERLTVCGGPSLPAAFDWLAAEAQRVASGP